MFQFQCKIVCVDDLAYGTVLGGDDMDMGIVQSLTLCIYGFPYHMGHHNLDSNLQNLPYGDTHTHTGIPICIQEEAMNHCENSHGDPHMHTIVVTMWGLTSTFMFNYFTKLRDAIFQYAIFQ
jgi:hypothetical protein